MSWRAAIGRHLRMIKLCVAVQEEGSSAGARKWALRRTNELLMLNPHFPFYIREGDSIDPYFYIEYDWGKCEFFELNDFSVHQVDDMLKKIVENAMNNEELQASREPCPPMRLRRPYDVMDEIGRPTPRIDYVLPSNNPLSEEERQKLAEEVERTLEEEAAAAAKEAARLEKKGKRNVMK